MTHRQPPMPGMYYKPPPPPRKRHTLAIVLTTIAAVIVAGAIASALSGAGKGAPRAGASTPAASHHHVRHRAARRVRPHLIARFHGSGIENTARFTTPATWKLKWSYSCASFGSEGNFAVNENGFGPVAVNELGHGGHGVTHGYNDAGRHYLEINSECQWWMKVIS
jgi:hypothetical protein